MSTTRFPRRVVEKREKDPMSTIAFGSGYAPRSIAVPQRQSTPRVQPPRLRLTPRGRRVLLTLAATPLVIAAFLFALNGGGATATLTGSSQEFTYVTVEAGQSLWQLAEQLAPNADPREVIARIVTLNQLESSDVAAGQELAIPAEYAG